MLVKTTQYKSSGISSANLLRALEIFDLPPAISPELNKCPGSNPVNLVLINNDTHQRETVSERPIRPPLRVAHPRIPFQGEYSPGKLTQGPAH